MQHTTELAERLVGIANELMQVAKMLGEGPVGEPVFPQEAVHKFVAGVCLNCGRTRKATKGQFRRGNCPTCSNRINREMKLSVSPAQAERQLVSEGLLAPKDFKVEPDPIRDALAKVAAQAETHFADPAMPRPGRQRKGGKK